MSCTGKPFGARWHTVVCVASGPSVTRDDCEKIRQWKSSKAGIGVIVVNTMFTWCPWADILYAMDIPWWKRYYEEASEQFQGQMISPVYFNDHVQFLPFKHGANSGQGAIELAVMSGAQRVILVGYDADTSNGKTHCHGDHPPGLANAGRVDEWPAQFSRTASVHAHVRIVNCSRHTKLTCFPRADLDCELNRRRVYVAGMKGLGDNIYQRAFLASLADHDVYLETPWPELYADMPHIMPVNVQTNLRTQKKNIATSKAVWHAAPNSIRDRRKVAYGAEGIFAGMQAGFGVQPSPLTLPDFGPSPVSGKYVVVRPVTVRNEWVNESRNPLPQYVAQAAAALSAQGFTVVSVADLAPGEEWAIEPLPAADIRYHAGELNVRQLLALCAGAAAIVGGIGWIVPTALALRKPALIICGGQGAYNSPEKIIDPSMDLDASLIRFVVPDHFCFCSSKNHKCRKTIRNYEHIITDWSDRLLTVVG